MNRKSEKRKQSMFEDLIVACNSIVYNIFYGIVKKKFIDVGMIVFLSFMDLDKIN